MSDQRTQLLTDFDFLTASLILDVRLKKKIDQDGFTKLLNTADQIVSECQAKQEVPADVFISLFVTFTSLLHEADHNKHEVKAYLLDQAYEYEEKIFQLFQGPSEGPLSGLEGISK